jgi:hypothetical protein
MATIPELLDGHVTLEVECLDRLYLNGYIGKLATGPGLSMFMRFQLEKPVPSPVVLGQVSELGGPIYGAQGKVGVAYRDMQRRITNAAQLGYTLPPMTQDQLELNALVLRRRSFPGRIAQGRPLLCPEPQL